MVRKSHLAANAGTGDPEFQWSLAGELAAVHSVAQGLRVIYERYRSLDDKHSIQWLALRCGYRSKGHLADVMSGRRPISRAKLNQALLGLGLIPISKDILTTIHDIARCKAPDEALKLENKIQDLRKAVKTVRLRNFEGKSSRHVIVLDVFSAFWLFGGSATYQDLLTCFRKKYTAPEIDEALRALVGTKLIENREGRWHTLQEHFTFAAKPGDDTLTEFIQSSLSDASQAVVSWFPQQSMSHFETVSISTTREKYAETLKEFKDQLLIWQTKLEAPNADMLIRLNVQLYPID